MGRGVESLKGGGRASSPSRACIPVVTDPQGDLSTMTVTEEPTPGAAVVSASAGRVTVTGNPTITFSPVPGADPVTFVNKTTTLRP